MAPRNPVILTSGANGRVTRVVPRGGDIPEHPWNWTNDSSGIVNQPIARPAKNRTLVLGADQQVVPVEYGTDQGGAVIQWAVVLGNLLYVMFIVGEGPQTSITQLGFGDSPSLQFGALGLVAGTDYNVYTGTDTQTADPIFAAIDATWIWQFPRLAYVTAKLNINGTNMDQVDVKSFRCVLGGRMVVDPRTDATLAEASRVTSDNAAICELDFIHERLFGLGALTSEINIASFIEGANVCDVVTAGGPALPSNTLTTTAFTGSGLIENGTFQWAVTNFDTNGTESPVGPWSADHALALAGINQHVTVGNIDVSGGTITSHGVYRRRKNPDLTYQAGQQVGVVADGTTTFDDFAATSSLTTTPPSTSDVSQFRVAVHVDSTQQETCQQTLDTFRQCFTSLLVFNDGQFQCVMDTVRDASGIAFDESNIVGTLQVNRSDPSQVPSQVQVNITDVRNAYAAKAILYPDSPAVGAGDARNDRAVQQFDLPWIPTPDQGLRVAIWLWKRLHRTLVFQWTTNQTGMLVLPGSIVTLKDTRAGITSPTQVIVTSVAQGNDKLSATLTAEIYNSADYDLNFYPGGSDSTGSTEPPAPPDPPTSLNLADVQFPAAGVPDVRIDLSWTPAVMPYETSTLVEWSIDNFVSDSHVLGVFPSGTATLYNLTLAQTYYFRLWTLRVANGELSATDLEGNIIATFNDPSIPEVTQAAFPWPPSSLGANLLEFYGPIPGFIFHVDEIIPTAPTVGVSSVGFGGCDIGTHEVAVVIIYPYGEGQLVLRSVATITGANQKIDVSAIAPGTYPQGLMYKLYLGQANVTGGTMYHVSEGGLAGGGGSGDTINRSDASLMPTDAQPVIMNGLKGWEVFCTNAIHTFPPIIEERLINQAPVRQYPIDCTSHVHEDPSTHAPRIDVLIQVVDVLGGLSTGVALTKNPAAWGINGPPVSVGTHITVVDGINDNLDIPVDANYIYVDDGGLTADFVIGGLTVTGIQPITRKRITLVNTTTYRVRFNDNSSGSTSGLRFALPASQDYDWGPQNGAVTIEYDTENSVWKVISSNGVGAGSTGGAGTAYILNQDLEQTSARAAVTGFFEAGWFANHFDGTVTTAGATYNDWVPDLYSGTLTLNGCTITGIVPPPPFIGGTPYAMILTLINGDGTPLILNYDDSGSAVANRFYLPGGLPVTASLIYQALHLQYSYLNTHWYLLGTNF